jgi:hypothetical protein
METKSVPQSDAKVETKSDPKAKAKPEEKIAPAIVRERVGSFASRSTSFFTRV